VKKGLGMPYYLHIYAANDLKEVQKELVIIVMIGEREKE
jgi:hypothetical protein